MERNVTPTDIRIIVKKDDALALINKADVLVLKYAAALHGVDRIVFRALEQHVPELRESLPKPFAHYSTSTGGAIAASNVLFVGVDPLLRFGYAEIRNFSRRALEALAEEAPHAVDVALTIHGPGFGLDETEAFKSEIAGLLDAISSGNLPADLKQITIVELKADRAGRLAKLLDTLLPDDQNGSVGRRARTLAGVTGRMRSVGYDSENKPHIFVAMQFAEEMDDVFHYGIQGAVNAAGFLCERADLSTFTGDVIGWVKKRIAGASLVIADLSDANPNVYLEVGYAWRGGRPTLLVVRDSSHLKFDVQGQRCLIYKKITDLETSLRGELENLKPPLLASVSADDNISPATNLESSRSKQST
jgi:hypothetical protein